MAIYNGKYRKTRHQYINEEEDDFYQSYDDCLENDEISAEEEAFMRGYEEAGY